MKKSEMEYANASHGQLVSIADAAFRAGDLRKAAANAVDALRHAEGMMRYARKYDDESFETVRCVELLLQLGPLLLDSALLDKVEQLLKATRYVEKNTGENLGDLLSEARARLDAAHACWSQIAQADGVPVDELAVGADNLERELCDQWMCAGLIETTPDGAGVRITTDLDRQSAALCLNCGADGKLSKREYLGEISCGGCGKMAGFLMCE